MSEAADLPNLRSPGRVRLLGEWFLRLREASVLVVVIALAIYFQISNPVFLSPVSGAGNNLVTVSQIAAPWAIIAVGEVLLMVSGEIDLSVGYVYTLAPFLMHYAVDFYGIPPILAIVLALLVCSGIGMINGFVTVKLRVPSFVATLGMFFAIYGIMLITSHAFQANIPTSAEGIAWWFGRADWSEIIWALGIVVVFQVVLTSTRWGLHTVATGGNMLGASEAGIRVGRIKMGNFVITSVLGGLTGILEAFRTDSISPTAGGPDVMFFAIASAVVGGTALAGGSGTVIGAFLGALMLGVLQNGFSLIGYSANQFYLVLGLAILVAMIANVYLSRLRRAGRA
jgi:simple sugar transport system permease protein